MTSDQRNHHAAWGIIYIGLIVANNPEPLVRIETTGAKSSVILLLLPYGMFRRICPCNGDIYVSSGQLKGG